MSTKSQDSVFTDNIVLLLLGETGVGKSTFINAFVNYVTHTTIDDALKSELISLIPSSFTITDADYNETVVKIGNDTNEVFDIGKSATQTCKTYIFPINDKKIVIIDTPGIGDTRGVEQDKKNFQHILQFVGNYDKINGICILLKPNNARADVLSNYCIHGLLAQLHKSASKNIVFCYTNSRSTLYRPGDTHPKLRKSLEDLYAATNVNIPLNKDNTFCFDSESFRFLAALKQGIKFSPEERSDFEKSWEKSMIETYRLLQFITTRPPHLVSETISLNTARTLISQLSRPIAEITKSIQISNNRLNKQDEKIRKSFESIDKLQKELYIPYEDLELRKLSHPSTVCTSKKCVKVLNGKVQYTTICHKNCSLKGVATDIINNAALSQCAAMDNGKCKICNCGWESHMHITYETIRINVKKVDESVQGRLLNEEDLKKAAIKYIEILKCEVIENEKEQKKIREICTQFAAFLKANAITPYNDSILDYINHLIEESELEGKQSTSARLIRERNAFIEEKQIFDEMLGNGTKKIISVDDVPELIRELENLPRWGKKLKEHIEMIKFQQKFISLSIPIVYKHKYNLYFLGKFGQESGEIKSSKDGDIKSLTSGASTLLSNFKTQVPNIVDMNCPKCTVINQIDISGRLNKCKECSYTFPTFKNC